MLDFIKERIYESIETKKSLYENKDILVNIETVARKLVEIYKNGNKVLIAGNGGSAADAQHIAAELVGRFYLERKGLPALALNTNVSILTALGNDYSYDEIFAKQIEAFGNKGDLFIGISTSGNSSNIINAFEKAKFYGLYTVALTGNKKSKSDDIADVVIKVPSEVTPRIQEAHILIGHILCEIIEEEIFGE